MKWRVFLVLLFIGTLVFMAGCVAGHNPTAHTANEAGEIAGFWMGLWHGLICVITLIISLFSSNVHMYEVHNNGGWYDFGFLLGAGLILGGGIRISFSSKESKD